MQRQLPPSLSLSLSSLSFSPSGEISMWVNSVLDYARARMHDFQNEVSRRCSPSKKKGHLVSSSSKRSRSRRGQSSVKVFGIYERSNRENGIMGVKENCLKWEIFKEMFLIEQNIDKIICHMAIKYCCISFTKNRRWILISNYF